MSFAQNSATARGSRGIGRVFTDRKINTKIGLGFACVLAITVLISAIAYSSLVRIDASIHDVERLGSVHTTASGVERQLVALRWYAREFALSGEEQVAANAEKAKDAMKTGLASGLKIIVDPEHRAKLAHASERLDVWSKAYDKASELRREQDKLQNDVLDPTAIKLQTMIDQLQSWSVSKAGNSILSGDAAKHLLIARLNVNKNIARHDQESAAATEKAFADLKAMMADFGAGIVNDEVRRLFTEVTTNIDAYEAASKRAMHNASEVKVLLNGDMRRIGGEIAKDAADVAKSAGAAEQAIVEETDSLVGAVERTLLVLAIGGIALGALLAWLIGRGISRPVQGMTAAMTALAGGDLKVVVPAQDNKDELGEMAKAVLVFRDAAIDKIRMEREAEEERVRSEAARRKAEEEAISRKRAMVSTSIGAGMAKLADKDLTFRLTDALPEAYRKLQSDFNGAMEQLEAALKSVRNSTNTIGSGTKEISTASDDLSRRTEQQAASLEETAAALDEITVTVNKTAEGAKLAREVVATAKTEAEMSGDVVRRAVDAMGRIEKSSQKISQIIGVIDEIAFQTNLLALNAGVEAARAGDAGRGFAVVASEVRALAQRSAEAAKEIKGLISTSTTEVGDGVKLVAETGHSLERIVTKVTEINGVVIEIAASAHEQATGLQQVNTAVNQMDQVTQQNAAMAEQATAASRSLAVESQQLATMVGQFQLSGQSTDHLREQLEQVVPHAFRDARKAAGAPKAAVNTRARGQRNERPAVKAVAKAPTSGLRVAAGGQVADESWEEF